MARPSGPRPEPPLWRPALPRAARSAIFPFVYVSDVVRMIVAALEPESSGETFFVGHPEPVTPRRLLETVRQSIGRRGTFVPVPMPVTWCLAQVCDVFGRATRRPALL